MNAKYNELIKQAEQEEKIAMDCFMHKEDRKADDHFMRAHSLRTRAESELEKEWQTQADDYLNNKPEL